MFSVRTALQQTLKDHLPMGFDPSNGLRALFPIGATARLSWLGHYLYSRDFRVDTGDINSQFFVRADGAGRWLLAVEVWGQRDSGQKIRAGFVFRYSDGDGTIGHGFVIGEGDLSKVPSSQLASGEDWWIAQNWPQAFNNGVVGTLQEATGYDQLPPVSDIWNDAGFPKFIPLYGQLVPRSSIQPSDSGGSGFPGPVDWDIPPTDDDWYDPPPDDGGDDGGDG